MNKNVVCHIGPGEDIPGGMLSVIRKYMTSEYLDGYEHIHIVSVTAHHKIKAFISSYLKLRKLIKSKNVDIVHIHMSERGSCLRAIVFINLCWKHKIHTVVHSHGSELEPWYFSLNKFWGKLFNSSMRKADAILVLTSGWMEFWSKIVLPENIYVVPNCVSIDEVGEKEYLKDGCLKILFMGQIGTRKGTYDLVKAVKIIKDSGHRVHLDICGDGEQEKCKDLIKRYSLSDEIEVVGWVSDDRKRQELKNADCLALPSLYESFGIVLLEGMANKLPCICGDGGYSKEIIENNVDGFVVKSGDENSIAEALEKLYDKALIKEMGQRAYYNVSCKFSEEKVIEKLNEIYTKLVSDR